MDIRMPDTDGIEATQQLTARLRAPRILILTTFDLDEYVYDALRAGASGFLLKDVTAERLFDAVRVIAAGDALLAPSITRRLIGEFAQQHRTPRRRFSRLTELTPRETEVLRLLAEGLSNPEIADPPRRHRRNRSRHTSAASSENSDCATEHKPSSPPTKPGSSHHNEISEWASNQTSCSDTLVAKEGGVRATVVIDA